MYWERRLVIISIFLLIFTNILVYILFFNSKYKDSVEEVSLYIENLLTGKCVDDISNDKDENVVEVITDIEKVEKNIADNQTWDIDIDEDDIDDDDQITDYVKDEIDKTFDKIETVDNWLDLINVDFTWQDINVSEEDVDWDLNDINIEYSNYLILTWTEQFTDDIKILKDLDLDEKYILVDKYNIYYAYLDTDIWDIRSKVQVMGWNIYEINDRQDIINNWLFGKQIIFINLPEYKDKIVNIIIKLQDDKYWFLQLDINLYYKSKRYIKTLFNK